jgi:hypothetical protein
MSYLVDPVAKEHCLLARRGAAEAATRAEVMFIMEVMVCAGTVCQGKVYVSEIK